MKTAVVTFENSSKDTYTAKLGKGVSVFHWGGWMYKHRLTIASADGKTTFTFYDHEVNPDEQDIKDAIESVISDAFYGLDSFEDYCAECGYDDIEDYKTAKRIHNACIRSLAQLTRIGLDTDSIFALYEMFS